MVPEKVNEINMTCELMLKGNGKVGGVGGGGGYIIFPALLFRSYRNFLPFHLFVFATVYLFCIPIFSSKLAFPGAALTT